MRSTLVTVTCLASALLVAACTSRPTQQTQQPLPDWYQSQKSTQSAQAPGSAPATTTASTSSSTGTTPSQPIMQPAPAPTSASTTAPVAQTPAAQAPVIAPATQDKTKTLTHTSSTSGNTTSAAAPTSAKNTVPQAASTPQTSSPAKRAVAVPKNQLQQGHPLEPFKASFRIYVSKIPMPITAELELTPQPQPDTWKMRFEVHSFLMHNLEESTFTWNNCHPKSIHYHHDFKGFGKHQFHDTSFFWNPPHVENHSDEDDKSFPIPADSVDDLTVLLQAACVFGEGATDYYATSIYGDQIRDNHFKLVRRETINSPLGKLDTLVVEKMRDHDNGRNTLFWISPKLNYMLVKAKHIENPVLFGEVIMKSYAGPHLPEK